ncbi:MAG TPA: ABC transporter permease, partial [Methylomirabilota bacterium]|nr:ABC transporter permease [Methylomirabilota bacterium]
MSALLFRVFRRIPRHQLALAAGLVMAVAVGAALLAPWLPILDPDVVDTPSRLRPPGSPGHLLGTDE